MRVADAVPRARDAQRAAGEQRAGGATILVKQVLSVADEMEIAAALDAFPRDVDVINASFGGPAADDERMLGLERALELLPEKTMAAFDRVVGVASACDTEAMRLPGGTSGVRDAAAWLIAQSGGPAIPGRTFIDTPVPWRARRHHHLHIWETAAPEPVSSSSVQISWAERSIAPFRARRPLSDTAGPDQWRGRTAGMREPCSDRAPSPPSSTASSSTPPGFS